MGWALVTGASGGIGEEVARELARRGHALVLTARSRGKLERLADAFRTEFGVEVRVMPADLSDLQETRMLAEEAARLPGGVHILVNNAGVGSFGPFAASDLNREEAMAQLNVSAVVVLTRVLLPGMLERGRGRILNVASTGAFQPGPLMAVYYASKAFVVSFSEALREETRGTGVTVTALCPGPTRSGFQKRAGMEQSPLATRFPMPESGPVAEYAVRAMFRGRGIAVHGVLNRIHVFAVRFLPRGILPRVVHWVQKERS